MSEIRIENLNKKIKGSVILDDISLTMTPGRIYMDSVERMAVARQCL